MTGRTQYGDLLQDASRHILAASVAVEHDRFANHAAAEQALSAWRDLLHALGRHGWQLFGTDALVASIRATGTASTPDGAALRLVDELATIGRRSPGVVPHSTDVAATSWATAAICIRAASDLLATHRGIDGVWRSPYGQILDEPSVRAVAFAEMAGLVVPVAEAANSLGLRTGQAGVSQRQVARMVPHLESLTDVAIEVRRLGLLPHGASALTSLEVARPGVRLGDPVVELGDRLARLHRVAWQLTREPHVGIGTLADFAVAGVLVHEQASRLLRVVSGSEPGIGTGQPIERLRQAGTAWRLIHLHTRQLRTATPPILGLRGDVLAGRDLCKRVMAMADYEQPLAQARALESMILGGARAFADVARWNLEVLENLAHTRRLYMPGRLLSGDEVTNDPALVQAKLGDRMMPAARERVELVRAAYRAAQRTVSLGSCCTASAHLEPQVYAQEPSAQ